MELETCLKTPKSIQNVFLLPLILFESTFQKKVYTCRLSLCFLLLGILVSSKFLSKLDCETDSDDSINSLLPYP